MAIALDRVVFAFSCDGVHTNAWRERRERIPSTCVLCVMSPNENDVVPAGDTELADVQGNAERVWIACPGCDFVQLTHTDRCAGCHRFFCCGQRIEAEECGCEARDALLAGLRQNSLSAADARAARLRHRVGRLVNAKSFHYVNIMYAVTLFVLGRAAAAMIASWWAWVIVIAALLVLMAVTRRFLASRVEQVLLNRWPKVFVTEAS